MSLDLPPRLAADLAEFARQQGKTPEALAAELLRRQVPLVPKDEWERRLLSAAIDCGVSPSDEALSREAMYD